MAEQLSREEAILFLTRQRDEMDDNAHTKEEAINVLAETGAKIGYAPTMRCLVMGIAPEDSIRWGK